MKKGISLIVLVITIIIIIILAGAVILNLNNNNPMDNANKAALMQEETDFGSGANLWFANIVSRTLQNPNIKVMGANVVTTGEGANATTTVTATDWIEISTANKTNSKDITNNAVSDIQGNPINITGYYDLEDILITEWTSNTQYYENGTAYVNDANNEYAGQLVLATVGTKIYNGYSDSTRSVPTYDKDGNKRTGEGATVTATSIVDAIGMKPSKAGKTNQYKIAMNKYGNIKFYTPTSTLASKNASTNY